MTLYHFWKVKKILEEQLQFFGIYHSLKNIKQSQKVGKNTDVQ